MQFEPGTRFGPYEVIATVAEGGMGTVYKARDTRLERIVALKVLPRHLSDDPELRQRFEREARAISMLSHPNICTLYDVGEHEGLEYLVMEYLEGDTLADRIARGPMPLAEVLRVGADVADALSKAHQEGIVHRDLKPGNIVLSGSRAKLVDFGLAKWMPLDEESLLTRQDDVTQRHPITVAGTILGTVPYMAPEQLEGKEIDARTDIFALGAILYEMATGQRAFKASSNASLIAAIIHDDPPPPSRLRAISPPRLDQIVQTCLQKDPNERFQSAHDVRLELQWLGSGARDEVIAAPLPPRQKVKKWALPLLLGAIALAALVFAAATATRRVPPVQPIRFSVGAPAGSDFPSLGEGGGIALSPNGEWLAFVATAPDGRSFLWLRALADDSPKRLEGTEGAAYPFWSPDSRSLAFFADGKLKRMEAPNGPPQTICDAAAGRGGAWSPSGEIIFAPASGGGLSRVPAGGGKPVELTRADEVHYSHRWPLILPDGKHFLFVAQSQKGDEQALFASSLDHPGQQHQVVATAASVAFAPPSDLLYVRDHVLVRQHFDVEHGRVEGDPVSISDGMIYFVDRAYVPLTASANGVIAYRRHATLNMRVSWYDRRGMHLGDVGGPGEYEGVSLSPDESRLVFGELDADEGLNHIAIASVPDGAPRRFTFGKGNQYSPIWVPTGERITYSDDHSGVETLSEKLATGGDERALTPRPAASQYTLSWSPDGSTLLYRSDDPKNGLDIATFSGGAAKSYISTLADESQGQFSPDGRYVAYASSESGRAEVYVQPIPATGAKWQVSTAGGEQPRWSRNGKELFYLAADKKLMSVPLHAGNTFDAGTPVPLFQTSITVGFLGVSQTYDVTRDGSRFVIISSDPNMPAAPITVAVR